MAVRLAHPLYGELLRATVPPLSRRAICRQLAEALQSVGGRRRDDLLRLAVWRMDSGVMADAALLAQAAKRASAAFFDHALAERLARAAVDAGGGARAERVLAETLFTQGRAEEAEALLARLEPTAPHGDQPHIALLRANNLFWGLGKALDAERVLRDAQAPLRESTLRDEAAVLRATIAFSRGRIQAALDDVLPILERADPHGRTGLYALTLATGAWAFAGRPEHAAAMAEQAAPPPGPADGELSVPTDRLLAALCVAYRLAGRLRQADALAVERYQVAVDRSAEELQAPGRCSLARTPWTGARLTSPHGGSARRRTSSVNTRGSWASTVAPGALGRSPRQARSSVTSRAPRPPWPRPTPQPRNGSSSPTGERGRVWLMAARGETSTACALAAQAAHTAADLGSHMIEAVVLHDVVRLGKPAGVVGRLSELAARLEGALPAAYADHAAAVAAADARGLDAASATFENLGATLLAAEAAAEASQAHRLAGRTGSALTSFLRSRRLLEGRQVRTPALDRISLPVSLTSQEREIATLTAQGLSNREIAERLGVAVRTVDNHLYNIFAKLGVHSRAELADIFGQPDP